jgi:hypothetical protein
MRLAYNEQTMWKRNVSFSSLGSNCDDGVASLATPLAILTPAQWQVRKHRGDMRAVALIALFGVCSIVGWALIIGLPVSLIWILLR